MVPAWLVVLLIAVASFGALAALRRWVPLDHPLFIPGLLFILGAMVVATWLLSMAVVEA